jgi:hypothetical protein
MVHERTRGANDSILSAAQGPGPFGLINGWGNPQAQALAGMGGGFMGGWSPQGYAVASSPFTGPTYGPVSYGGAPVHQRRCAQRRKEPDAKYLLSFRS